MILKAWHILLATFLCIGISSVANAHGGGSESSSKPVVAKPPAIRVAAKAPKAIDASEIERLSASGYGQDVLAVDCKLGEFTSCRGLDISITDISGKHIATGNTGTNGLVGFEGLKPHVNYIAKIESDRYDGVIQVKTGRLWALSGERK